MPSGMTICDTREMYSGPSRTKPLGAEYGGQLGSQQLHCDLAVVLEVVGPIERSHPAGSHLFLDGVPVG